MPRSKNRGSKRTAPPKLFVPTLISRVFDPPIIMVVLSSIGIFLSDLSNRGYLFIVLFVPVFVGLPFGYLLWSIKTRHVSNWDITNRKERIVPLLVLLVFLAADIGIVSLLDNVFLINMFFLYFLWTLGFLVITLVWKISGHTGVITLAAGVLVKWFGISFLPLFLFIPLVAWARLVRRDHTWLQVIGGSVYSLGILAFWSMWVY